MMAMKTRKLVTVLVALGVILIITAAVLGILYLNTDLLKSKRTLFAKYIGQGIEQSLDLIDMEQEKEYSNIKKTNNYEASTEISGFYIENYNTSSESATDLINNLKLTIDEKNSFTTNQNYQDIKLVNDGEETLELETFKNEQAYGIRFTNLFTRILSIENSNLTELAEKLELNISTIPDSIEFETTDYSEVFKFTDEEIATLKANYIDTILKSLSKDKFTKLSNAVITINNTSISTNAYVLTLTQEEINNVYIQILQNLENDQIILNKIAKIDEKIYEEQQSSEYENYITNIFKESVEEEIKEIQDNNIGQNQIKISVYKQKDKTVRIKQESDSEDITIDFNITDTITEMDYQIEHKGNIITKDQTKITKENNALEYKYSIYYQNLMADETNAELDFSRTISNMSTNSITTNTQLSYLADDNRIGINIDKELNINDSVEIEEQNEEDNIILNTLTAENLNSLIQEFTTVIQTYSSEPLEKLKQQYQTSILNLSNINSSVVIENSDQMSNLDINRFNSKFIFYSGEHLDYETIEKLLNIVAENFGGMEVISGTEIKLNIKQGIQDEATIQNILGILKNRSSFTVKINYDENNLINNIVLTIETT